MMRKKLIIGAGMIAGILLLSGCTGSQPQPRKFNPNNKTLEFIDGKPYYAPMYAIAKTMSKKDTKGMKRDTGITCSAGSALWFEPSYLKVVENSNSKQDLSRLFKNGFRQGKIGCAKPLSNQEYQYRLNQQNQYAANARASAAQAQAQQNSYNNQIQQNNMQMQNRTNNIMRNVTNTNIRMSNGYY